MKKLPTIKYREDLKYIIDFQGGAISVKTIWLDMTNFVVITKEKWDKDGHIIIFNEIQNAFDKYLKQRFETNDDLNYHRGIFYYKDGQLDKAKHVFDTLIFDTKDIEKIRDRWPLAELYYKLLLHDGLTIAVGNLFSGEKAVLHEFKKGDIIPDEMIGKPSIGRSRK